MECPICGNEIEDVVCEGCGIDIEIYSDLVEENPNMVETSEHEFFDDLEDLPPFEYEQNTNIDQTEQTNELDEVEGESLDAAKLMIQNRECCKLHGRLGDNLCNICGRVIPEELRVHED